jgi:glycerol-3-phosphate cytidylyltransferase
MNDLNSAKIITYGTFDLLHTGHLSMLHRLRALGGRLTVGVSTDEFNAMKGKRAVYSFAERAEILRNLRCVDAVIPERDWEQKARDIVEHGIDVFGMGDDWQGRFDHLTPLCRVVYLPRTAAISTTEIRGRVKALVD